MANGPTPVSLTRQQLYLLAGGVVFLLVLAVAVWWQQVYLSSHERSASPAAAALEGPGEGADAYTNLAGEAITLDAYLGRVLVVLSWASWCPSCAEGLARVRDITATYPSDQVTYLAINRAEPKETAERYINVMQIATDEQIILDPTDRYYQAIDGYAMPELVVYTAAGDIHQRLRGRITDAQLRTAIDSALQVH